MAPPGSSRRAPPRLTELDPVQPPCLVVNGRTAGKALRVAPTVATAMPFGARCESLHKTRGGSAATSDAEMPFGIFGVTVEGDVRSRRSGAQPLPCSSGGAVWRRCE